MKENYFKVPGVLVSKGKREKLFCNKNDQKAHFQ